MNWDYDHSILQVSGSLYRYFGMDRGHGSDPEMDAYLDRNRPQCIIAVLIDALGTSILDSYPEETAFLRSHLLKSVSTVYPPTTTAATTSFLTGRSPAENGWLGWNQYFKEKDDNIILFLNRSQYGGTRYPAGWSEHALPVEKIYDLLNRKDIPADSVWPGWAPHNPADTYASQLELAAELTGQNRFLYVYHDLLDDMLHRYGTDDERIREKLIELNDETERFMHSLPESVSVLVIADHSQINVRCIDLEQDEEICACFAKPPALEPRTLAFYIKEGMEQRFEQFFRSHYGSEFLLLNHQETISSGIFGPGIPHERFEEFIGDYTAFAISDIELDYMRLNHMKGDHAGMVKEERYIPVILMQGAKTE
ncbi:MAG: alkaline phosphatase family protein [Solobacterium sp.]|nr:alkaline phosphatase family protein [Solobacterium sp.]